MNSKTHIYFVPGLAASSKIFEYLKLPKETFELHFLEWLMPLSENEKIEDYAKRMAQLVREENPVLIGVSFGGIMVQEMSKHLNAKKIILISSVKNRNELPKRLKVIQKTWVYKLFPSKSINNIEDFSKYAFGDFAKKRVKLYKEYLSVRNSNYLNWAIYNVLHWKQKKTLKNIIHIHGTEDHVFPIKHIKNCISIDKGTHVMILNKANTISKIITQVLN
ncbi:pimeloyl-ACP methyl ester carboxylesterase [Lutibacter oceani]|uniref:Pimeloyl-ACP methyl ester carboxylesterase n=1 Tax=Lutibacter oceani TaxID=1853311 RepID=A0A3D9RK99_9FLAO|nr:alpha/beta hydrolase [Lutibacter oceani]REE79958.1 pimeloyl-ACP methyl ester carboxylesterase [Lutibacter oceani]